MFITTFNEDYSIINIVQSPSESLVANTSTLCSIRMNGVQLSGSAVIL